jgi:hypothetical protein
VSSVFLSSPTVASFRERDAGDPDAAAGQATSSLNDGFGIRVQESGSGSAMVAVSDATLKNKGPSG